MAAFSRTSFIFVPLFWLFSLISASNPKHYNIGAVLSFEEHVIQFRKIVQDINFEGDVLPSGVTLNSFSILKQLNPIDDTRNFCHNLMPHEVSVVIVDDRIPSEAITMTASLHNIPVIGLTNRQCVFSDKSLYGSYMRTSSTYSHQADVWIQLLLQMKFECAHFFVSDSIDGRNIKTRFLQLAELHDFIIETIIEYDFMRPYIVPDLEEIKEQTSSCRVNVLFADHVNSAKILNQIIMLNMTGANSVWIVSEQALNASNLPIGFLGVRYKDWNNIDGQIMDSIYVVANAIKAMHKQINFTQPPSDCRDIGRPKWLEGDIFYEYLREQSIIFGKTGKISFDERGDRLFGDYEILNQQPSKKANRFNIRSVNLINVGSYSYNRTSMKMSIDIQQENIVWPGNKTRKPQGYTMPTHLRIVTLGEAPFVWVLPPDQRGFCGKEQIFCPIRKKNSQTGKYYEEAHCCEGYCIDLLRELAKHLNFTYTLSQVEDGLYGSFTYNNKTGQHEWTGLLGELYYSRADMVVAALTITPERSMAIDFTKPFKYQGITILQKLKSIHRLGHPLTSFLQPFQNSLWVSIFVAVHVVALTLYLLDRFSPFGRYKLPSCETITEEDALNLSSAIWFAWGILFNSGIAEGTPRSFSGRVLGIVWAGFAMIIIASYTANLAAFLVLDRPQTALTGINDPRMRNPSEKFNYSTVRDSAVSNYFKRQVELLPMYKRMAENFFDNVEDAITAIKSGTLSAFIWDSARLEYEAANDCELIISGEYFGRSGYAIGLPKEKKYWMNKLSDTKLPSQRQTFLNLVTLALLGMHEIGFMEDLDNKWILLNEQVCEIKQEQFPPTLGFKNMAGVFILVATGILGGSCLIMFEIFYKQNQTRNQRRLELARNAIDKWKEVVENRKLLLESMNLTAKQRYRNRHQVHRRREELRNTSKSFSDEKSESLSSLAEIPGGITIEQQQKCNNLSNQPRIEPTMFESSSYSGPQKPTYLELTQTNVLPTMFDVPPPSRYRRFEPEQHPRANARIYHPNKKPKLRREFSFADEPEAYNVQKISSFQIDEDDDFTNQEPSSPSLRFLPPPPPPPASSAPQRDSKNFVHFVFK